MAAKKKKNVERALKKKELSLDELKEQMFTLFMKEGGDWDDLSYSDEYYKIAEKLREQASKKKAILPEFTLTLAELKSIRDFLKNGPLPIEKKLNNRLTKWFSSAVIEKDDQQMFEYHEREMLRHAEELEARRKKIHNDIAKQA